MNGDRFRRSPFDTSGRTGSIQPGSIALKEMSRRGGRNSMPTGGTAMRAIFSLMLLVVLLTASDATLARVWSVNVGGTMGGGYGYGNPVLQFSPANITINAGDSVTFTNLGGAMHNVHADDNSFRCANGCDDTGGDGSPSASDWTFTRTFSTPGTITYHCDIHSGMGMVGSITVNSTVLTLGGYMSGAWYHPGQAGHGFDLELTTAPGSTATTKTMVAFWYVYTPDGSAQNWVYAQGDYDPTASTVTLPATLYTGGRFPPNFNQADVTSLPYPPGWGTLTFTFSDCNNGTVSWHSDLTGYNLDNDMPLTIARLTQIDGTTCP
jgi:plastocyanin